MTIPDSFAGVLFPPRNVQDSESFLFRTWNMCGDDTLTASEQELRRALVPYGRLPKLPPKA